ncbi:hypothetical protein [Terribacillus halophilus]|uniref:hypothetical protein n=1 Tax=Terribacillus halophilus TaxID=361279 RepID=UPI0009869934|nr:hypothetical protein [Terribacillus halophilus]
MTKLEFIDSLLKSTIPFVSTIVAFMLGRLGTNTDRKLEYRTYLDVDEISAQYNLKNMSSIKDGTRLIMPNEFIDIYNEIETGEYVVDRDFQYLKIRPIGKSIISSASINVIMKSVDKKDTWSLDISLPILEVNEEIYIYLHRKENLNRRFYVESTAIKYQTQSGEKILYKSEQSVEGNQIIFKSSVSTKKLFGYKSINDTEMNTMAWIYLNRNNDDGKN